MTDAALAEAEARRARSAQALRENLRRRKEQARARRHDAGIGPATPTCSSDSGIDHPE